ncbi:hypothetical protein NDU88_001519 [Pleurodeles waltl]|uniref:Uncharacterized protein n=1 Tax=Pleurodeles waltl TaxID=8319 RepID=A0AAV7WIJ5_PLEWA|nr:hypothetical protein NDU88_001519 [Pleurodeles waltl]
MPISGTHGVEQEKEKTYLVLGPCVCVFSLLAFMLGAGSGPSLGLGGRLGRRPTPGSQQRPCRERVLRRARAGGVAPTLHGRCAFARKTFVSPLQCMAMGGSAHVEFPCLEVRRSE